MADSRPMPPADHRAVLADAAGDLGFLRQLGDDHLVLHRPAAAANILIVTFEMLDVTRARDGGLPLSTGLARERGWATLDVLAEGRTWFRDEAVIDFFDGLTYDGFFDDFDSVIFVGGGMGAYGAAAFSVSAPGATVFLMQPYATLARDVTPWERRFRSAWSLPFGPRYGNAARMIDAARRVYVVTDPTEVADAMHASLFNADHVVRLPAPHAGSDIQRRIESTGALGRLIVEAETGTLDPARFARIWRTRRQDATWVRGLMRKVERMDRPFLSALVAGHMVRQGGFPAAHRRLNAALSQLSAEGRAAPAHLHPTPPPDNPRPLLAGE
ncbi:phosphoadenosine phosphosulfate reductase [Jannaschia rubra]|uniref:Phosphoadenosine phosphosulfate reductase n=1 Tax=Jannaschia rubra TaxID=282197 RepID=A0A0M6XP16_9RHOB|nr:phosphoadenosine phosphosulfate reductase [Jannaschia rubra]CTQ32920.1 hypothetical protein JAN5088_01694 [Jannaschia rubra]SFG27586.1 hypothetical protein SAMN04488517_103424 [Jannaschia rubra]